MFVLFLSVCLIVCLFVLFLSVCLFVCFFFCPFVCLFACFFVGLFVCLLVCFVLFLSVCLQEFMFAQSMDSSSVEEIQEFMEESIKGALHNFPHLYMYNVVLSCNLHLACV